MRPDGSQPPPEEAAGISHEPLSDADQTLGVRDQTLSDRDQQASDDDQAASDWGRQHGIDPGSHARTTAIRDETARELLETGGLRDQTAVQRDRAAHERDELAAGRDHDAAICDEEALDLDASARLFDRYTGRVQDLHRRAAEGRKRAAHDRELAARDRAQAARDRERASHDREYAGTDELTGARRRGVGLEELQREIDRARRTDGKLVAAFVDVDDLKSVNDRHGHHAGDELLRNVADGLRRHMRSYDLLMRLGGDEFLCALPGVTLIEARRRLDSLRSELRDGPAIRSMSFGLSELRDGESPQELIDRADRELLAARISGS
jgi:diguanylate cyclase (GGDEF)-like protein